MKKIKKNSPYTPPAFIPEVDQDDSKKNAKFMGVFSHFCGEEANLFRFLFIVIVVSSGPAFIIPILIYVLCGLFLDL